MPSQNMAVLHMLSKELIDYSEDMLAGWDCNAVIVEDYTIHCIQVFAELMVLSQSWWQLMVEFKGA